MSERAEHSTKAADAPRPKFDLRAIVELYPFRSRWWESNGLRYHYLDEGSGDVLFMLHGNPTWSFFYRELIREFRKDHRVIALDQMGCGLSDRPTDAQYPFRYERRIRDVRGFLEHMGIDGDATLVAHDWGGIIGTGVAARHPDLFSRFVLMNTAGFRMPSGKKLPWQLRYVKKFPILPELQIRGFNAFVRLATVFGLETRMPSKVKRGYRLPYDSWHNRLAVYRFIQDIAIDRNEPSYEAVKVTDENLHNLKGKPMLIIWGARDFIFDMEILAEWRKRFPEAEYEVLEDAGHFVLEDARERCISAISDFLRDNPLKDEKRGEPNGRG